jgi:hypothetical protein
MTVAELLNAWRADAETLAKYGAAEGAATLRRCVEQLEQAMTGEAMEPLNLQQAARESGYTPDHLGELVRQGQIPNAGRRRSPRIRRQDLPRKPPAGHPPLGRNGELQQALEEAAAARYRRR